ncbi:hypothetical protein QWZ13_15570 [Reinekea marina]|nr:hypothetical protein [Reinekea marina]MDN3650325.1 hypothetical protein [Reinekea marina]
MFVVILAALVMELQVISCKLIVRSKPLNRRGFALVGGFTGAGI